MLAKSGGNPVRCKIKQKDERGFYIVQKTSDISRADFECLRFVAVGWDYIPGTVYETMPTPADIIRIFFFRRGAV